jgi:hypothetical protein
LLGGPGGQGGEFAGRSGQGLFPSLIVFVLLEADRSGRVEPQLFARERGHQPDLCERPRGEIESRVANLGVQGFDFLLVAWEKVRLQIALRLANNE